MSNKGGKEGGMKGVRVRGREEGGGRRICKGGSGARE